MTGTLKKIDDQINLLYIDLRETRAAVGMKGTLEIN